MAVVRLQQTMEVMPGRSNTRSNKPPGVSLRVVSAHFFDSNWTLALSIKSAKKENFTKGFAGRGGRYKTDTLSTELPRRVKYCNIFSTYEGDSICNEIVPINQKVLYLYTLQLHFQKGLLLGYTTAKSQLSSSFTTLHNPLSSKGTKLHCDTNLSSGFKFRILYELSLFLFCLFVW